MLSQEPGDPIVKVTRFLKPFIAPIVQRINVDEFTTVEFIEAMQLDEIVQQAYQMALNHWPESDETLAKMVIHGQVIPQLLRETELVDWAGYAHGENDPYAIPAWWRKRESEP